MGIGSEVSRTFSVVISSALSGSIRVWSVVMRSSCSWPGRRATLCGLGLIYLVVIEGALGEGQGDHTPRRRGDIASRQPVVGHHRGVHLEVSATNLADRPELV